MKYLLGSLGDPACRAAVGVRMQTFVCALSAYLHPVLKRHGECGFLCSVSRWERCVGEAPPMSLGGVGSCGSHPYCGVAACLAVDWEVGVRLPTVLVNVCNWVRTTCVEGLSCGFVLGCGFSVAVTVWWCPYS